MQTKRAKDLMIPLENYPHIPCWYTLLQAMEEMEKHQIEVHGRKSLPRVVLVFDLDSSLSGIVRRRDILRGLEPDFLSADPYQHSKKLFDIEIDPNLVNFSYDNMINGFKKRAERPVTDVLLPAQITVDYMDHIMKIIYMMVKNNRSLLPVIKDNIVVGVVRSVEVYREIAQTLIKNK
jgi:CBS domain-containing protein